MSGESGSYSRCTNWAVKAMKRMRACSWRRGSLVPVTVKEPRKPARLPIAAKFSKVANFSRASPMWVSEPSAAIFETSQYSVV